MVWKFLNALPLADCKKFMDLGGAALPPFYEQIP